MATVNLYIIGVNSNIFNVIVLYHVVMCKLHRDKMGSITSIDMTELA